MINALALVLKTSSIQSINYIISFLILFIMITFGLLLLRK